MTKKLFVILLLTANCTFLFAQTLKTDVLVIGGGNSGVAAALQCARSKVKTVLITETALLGDSIPQSEMFVINANNNVPSGIWGEFRLRVHDLYKGQAGYDTTFNGPLKLEGSAINTVLKQMTDTVKKLTIYLNTPFVAIKKDGDYWDVSVTRDEKTTIVKARVVIDATPNGDVATKAGAQFTGVFNNDKDNSQTKYYRTAIACGEALPGQLYTDANAAKTNYPQYPAYCIPLNAVLVKNAENILVTEKAVSGNKNIQYLPLQTALGQGTATVAAFCAFFKTTTEKLKVRIIQGELLDFKGDLLPFTDIAPRDPNWRAIQQIAATGLLKGVQQVSNNKAMFFFKPDSLVNTAEVKPVLTEIYTRAFLWFSKEKTGEKFTVGNLLSFISDYTLTDPTLLNSKTQKAWKSQYKFTTDFDLNHPVTRREFAVLANKFLNPFARTVDLQGAVVN